MALSSLYVTNLSGNILISRDYRGAHNPDAVINFMANILKNEDENRVRPVFHVDESTFAFVKQNDLYFITVIECNANITLVFVFLYKIINLIGEYFNEVEEESVRDNFVVMHELLDEVLDFGYPQTTEATILKEYVTQEGAKLEAQRVIPRAVTNAISWRSEGIKYKKNEIFVDVMESVNLIAKANGVVVRREVMGSIILKTRLSGMPELLLGLNDKTLYSIMSKDSGYEEGNSVDLDEVRFHQCVCLWKFERDRSISFIPPDGEFELMSYRINSYVELPIIVESVVEIFPKRKINVSVKATTRFRSRLTASAVLVVPVPSDVDSPVLRASDGVARYSPDRNAIMWTLKALRGIKNDGYHIDAGKELSLTASFGLPSVPSGEAEALGPVQVQFEMPFFNPSGLTVKYLRVAEKSGYSALSWVRYVTRSGDYQVRQKEIRHNTDAE